MRKTWIKSVCQRLSIIASECKQEEVKERERERGGQTVAAPTFLNKGNKEMRERERK